MTKENFTPLFDNLIDAYNLTVAAVYGKIWRYCQMKRGYCHAEQSRLADELGLSRETVNRAISVLVTDGWINDRTPNTKGKTRIYQVTAKLGSDNLPYIEPVSVPVTGVVSEPVSEPVIKSHTSIDSIDKIDKTPTTSGGGSLEKIHSKPSQEQERKTASQEFLDNATEEQREAYLLVKQFAGENKAVEVASRDHPKEAARDFLEYCAERGNHTAQAVLDETIKIEFEADKQKRESEKRHAEIYSEFHELVKREECGSVDTLWREWVEVVNTDMRRMETDIRDTDFISRHMKYFVKSKQREDVFITADDIR